MARERVLILLHEHDPYPELKTGFVWGLADEWEKSGIEVITRHGISDRPEAEVVIPHIDVTVQPDEYRRFLEAYPRVINRGVVDISKRRISRNLVSLDDQWDGPVIVKTDRNCGGIPERNVVRKSFGKRSFSGAHRWGERLTNRLARLLPRTTRAISPAAYKVYPSPKTVPRGVFENSNLVVERFLPELEDGLYVLRLYIFLGDRYINVRVRSQSRVVKGASIGDRREVPLPSGMVKIREELGFDYGKLDYVMQDDVPVLLDANSTPGTSGRTNYTHGQTVDAYLAAGLGSFF